MMEYDQIIRALLQNYAQGTPQVVDEMTPAGEVPIVQRQPPQVVQQSGGGSGSIWGDLIGGIIGGLF